MAEAAENRPHEQARESLPYSDGYPPVIGPGHTMGSVTEKISSIVLGGRTKPEWILGFVASFILLQALLVAVSYLLVRGTGIWGINVPVAWGFAIINFVWWIGIGHAGTLISAILLLFRQDWRTSINRFAEAMTLFAVACAGIFPLLHTGRPWLAFWMLPYPNSLGVQPQFRSPLIWDVFAVTTYGTVSLLFWYVGLIPDLATLRDRARNRFTRAAFAVGAMGWRGASRHWHRYETAYLLLAGISTPLVLSVHSVVSLDFAVSIVPGWHATIFPPYFVAGAIYAGFAMVLTLLIPLRRLYRLEDFITMRHIHNCAKLMLATGLIVFYGYLAEMFYGWYGGNKYERDMLYNRMTGPYAPLFWSLIVANGLVPQALWSKRLRSNLTLPELGRWQTLSLAAGAAVIALAAVVAFLTANARGFFFSYLMAYVFWTGVAAGCLALAMLQFVARGAWGVAIRRVVESGARTLPLMALMFLPIAAGMGELFPWSRADAASDESLRLKQAYLNKPFFIARAAVCFAVWLALAYFIDRWSGEQDRTGAHRLTDYMRNLSGPGIVLFGLTVTLASTDWVMSLDPHWASSIFGILFMGGLGLSALTFVVVLLSLLGRYEPLRSALTLKHFHDLGTLMFALVMLYTYFAFSQFLIIWSGNLPEEIPWYLRRMTGGWQFVGVALVVFHFAAPFLLLLSRKIKRRVGALGLIAGALLVMRVVDTFYLVAPEGTRAHGAGAPHVGHFPGPVETLLYVALPIGMGGLWLAFFIRQLRRRPLLPPNDPLIDRALRHGREGDHLF